jgi:hypothetical protein
VITVKNVRVPQHVAKFLRNCTTDCPSSGLNSMELFSAVICTDMNVICYCWQRILLCWLKWRLCLEAVGGGQFVWKKGIR